MRWPRWIAAFTVLIIANVATAQTSRLSPSVESGSAFVVPAPQELPDTAASEGSSNSGTLDFDAELERFRKEVANTKALREQATAETANQPADNGPVVALQRRELMELLTKLATKNLAAKPEPPPVVSPPVSLPVVKSPPESVVPAKTVAKTEVKPEKPEPHPLITEKVIDAYALGRALFKAEDFVGAEQAFRKVSVTDDNRVQLQYLIATCLRKQSRWTEAAKAFRIVAENDSDPALRDLAKWQLDNIRWYQQTGSQLDKLRKMREKSSDSKNLPKTASGSELPN